MLVPQNTKFLVTTQPKYELDSASEIWHCLYMTGHNETSIRVYFIKKRYRLVAGLIAIAFEGDPLRAVENIRLYLEKHPWILKYTNKVIPVEVVSDDINTFVENITKLANRRITNYETWRITVSKHASKIKTSKIIDAIASKIKVGRVSLKDFNWIINIDAIGENLLGSVIKPYHIISKKEFFAKIKATKLLEYLREES